MIQLPSEHQIGDVVFLSLWSTWLQVEIISVKFHKSHVSYDVQTFSREEEKARLYNIDEKFLKKRKEGI